MVYMDNNGRFDMNIIYIRLFVGSVLATREVVNFKLLIFKIMIAN